jgi:NAD(P)-dependent dehydrogenase (short-subunit alcohol dehydrogenase family)
MTTRNVLITGGAGGLGGATSRHLAEKGWRVFAADLVGEPLDRIGEESGITPVPLDVTDLSSIEAAKAVVSEAADGLDGVVNFAGILAMGSMVEIPVSQFERLIEINLLGTFRVNRAFFPLVLKRKGRIINISSETGWETVPPFNGAYSISKHAIEAYTDALRRELMFLGVDVIKIQPGPFKTEMTSSIESVFDDAVANSTHFAAMLERVKDLAVGEQDKAHDPQLIADTVYEALSVKSPKIAYSIKPDTLRTVLSYLPEPLIDRVLGLALRTR